MRQLIGDLLATIVLLGVFLVLISAVALGVR